MPVVEIWLAVPDSNDWHGPFSAIVDTGADFTIVPQSVLHGFSAPYLKRVMLRTQWSQRQPVGLYEVDLRIGELVFPGIDVAGDRASTQILLGRNVLNRLDLRLEGPKLRTHILGG
jgi:predicted aspartyl protease